MRLPTLVDNSIHVNKKIWGGINRMMEASTWAAKPACTPTCEFGCLALEHHYEAVIFFGHLSRSMAP